MNRRDFIAGVGLSLAAGTTAAWSGLDWVPDRGLRNPCLAPTLPEHLAGHPVVREALTGLNADKVWDCHVHLVGTGNTDPEKLWVNPALDRLWHPFQFLQKRVYMNAACVADPDRGDQAFIERFSALVEAAGIGRPMLLAFDYNHDEQGLRRPEFSTFYVSNAYTHDVAAAHPDWEWICSVHPYRGDAIDALHWAVEHGARAVKWLPPAMGMDPASPRCDNFYTELQRLDMPLLTHGGHEFAAKGGDHQAYGDPRRLRRALDHGVRVIVAHCASLGDVIDIRVQEQARPALRNFRAFLDMMREPDHAELLFGDLSAVTQVNRAPEALQTLLEAEDLHPRLLNGSDYPLVGILPLFSLRQLKRLGLIDDEVASVVAEIQRYNPLLFDLVLKRSLRWKGHRFPAQVFETADFFRRSRPGA
jgi:predicted TIM-barrel fold metal-dependent hydrolase